MPKVVDQEARRQHIADALLSVVRRQGVSAVSVRSVAVEAGLSVGSMRHTVASQGELLVFAMGVVAERASARIQRRITGWGEGREPTVDQLTDLCGEVVPLDPERRAEAAVWLELVTLARTDARLAAVSAEAHAGLRALASRVVGALLPTAPADRVEQEAMALHALLDGLALHGVLHPDSVDVTMLRALVRDHLAGRVDR